MWAQYCYAHILYQPLQPKDENIANYGYIGDISTDILEKNIDKLKIDQNL